MKPELSDDMVDGMDEMAGLHLVHKPAARNSAFYWRTGEPSVFASLESSAKQTNIASTRIKKARAAGTDRSTIHGLSRKSDELSLQRMARSFSVESRESSQRSADKRDALRRGGI